MRTVKEKLSLCRLYSSLLDHKDSFPLHFNLRFNPDNCSCLTRHWQLAAPSSFKNTSSRRSWDEASLAHSLVVMCFTKRSGCIVGELTVSQWASSDDVFDSFLLICPFVSFLLVAAYLSGLHKQLQDAKSKAWKWKHDVYKRNSFAQQQENPPRFNCNNRQ